MAHNLLEAKGYAYGTQPLEEDDKQPPETEPLSTPETGKNGETATRWPTQTATNGPGNLVACRPPPLTWDSVNRTGFHRGLVVWAICGVVGLV